MATKKSSMPEKACYILFCYDRMKSMILNLQVKNMKKLLISFSARANGNSDKVAEHLALEGDKIIHFRDMNIHSCRNCNYECFSDYCKYHHDDIYHLFEEMNTYQKTILIVPMYCGNPSSLYFVFNERCQDYFMHHEDTYENIIKRLFIIGIYGTKEQSPDFISCFEKWFNGSKYSNHVLGIERHKYNLEMKDSILDIEEIKTSINEFINPTNAKVEVSAMAVVKCRGKILATTEMIYGKKTLSLPKGHTEESETPLDAAIRECYEETNIVVNETNLVQALTPYTYEFLTPANQLIRKTLIPYLFEVSDYGVPLPKEERMLSVQWMSMVEFMLSCPYENVKNIVHESQNI